ncbi:MAG: hypothetical protein WA919_01080, partial [Coleofasciculaceae cyanobacterium]
MTMESFDDFHLHIADRIAQTLADEQIRINRKIGKNSDGIATELKKTVTYLYANQDQPNARAKFFKYLKTLVGQGKQVGYSEQTTNYYRCIEKACKQHLQGEQANPRTMLLILGWAARLVRYHKDLISTSETYSQTESASAKPQSPQDKSNYKYIEGQVVDGKIIDLNTRDVDRRKTKSTIIYEVDGEKLGKNEEIYNMHKKGISLK